MNRQEEVDNGIRRTIAWNLSEIPGEDTLIYVFDETEEILYKARIRSENDIVVEENLQSDRVAFYNIQPAYTPTCYTDVCVKKTTDVNAVRACNAIVGSQCRQLGGSPYAQIVCRGGVFVACVLMEWGKTCVQYERRLYCPY